MPEYEIEQSYKNYGVTSTLTDAKEPFLVMKTRWNYLNLFIPRWKNAIRYRLYTMSLLVAGFWLLFSAPLVAIVCLFLAMYFDGLRMMEQDRLQSGRKVIIGQ